MKHSILSGLLASSLFSLLGSGPAVLAQEPVDDAGGAAAAEVPEVVLFKLRSGGIQWGSVEEHSVDSLTLRRLDTNGIVTLPWAFLDSEQELELRTRFGYVELDSDEMLISAELLILENGQELLGLIVDRTDDAILFKTGGYPVKILKSRIRNHVAGLQAPALEIYTKEELYADELTKIDPALPESQMKMGEFCERILDFRRALEHYRLARELDEEFMPGELEVILDRMAVKVENQDQIEALAAIDHLNRRKFYEKAILALTQFDSDFPDSPLRADRLKLEQRVFKARGKYLLDSVSKKWFSWMGRLASKAAREMTLEQALDYLEEGFGEEIVANVTEELRSIQPDIEEDTVRQLFIERKRGRWKPASYGLGTWLLGEDDALKGGPETRQKEKPKTELDAAREKREEQIKRFLRNQATVKRASKSAEDEEEVEDAWKLLSSASRSNWIIASYAENSGDLDLRPNPELRNCSECGGTGAKEVIYTGGAKDDSESGLALETCRTCHGLGRTRRIRYR